MIKTPYHYKVPLYQTPHIENPILIILLKSFSKNVIIKQDPVLMLSVRLLVDCWKCRRLIKSFSGVQGACFTFSQKSPLAAGGFLIPWQ
jgi:hypothetical protein